MDSFSQARTGIQLAQQGRRAEALRYLRLASQQEPPHPEVWLWLAHVTPSLEEYRFCIQQALRVAPNHIVARQMDSALRTVPAISPAAPAPPTLPPGTGPISSQVVSQPVAVDANLINRMQRQRRKRSRRQRLMGLIAFVLLVGLVGAVVLIIGDDLLNDSNDNIGSAPELMVTLQLSNQETPLRFRMATPPSWLLATLDDTRWINRSTALANNPAIQANWARFASDVTAVTINPADDSLGTPVSIVETNEAAILESDGYPLRLQLIRYGAIYASMDDASCQGLQQLAAEQQNALSSTQITAEIIENQVVQQSSGTCVYLIHYVGTSALSGQTEHIYVIYVPVGLTALAEWHLTVIDTRHDQYRPDIEQLLDTLRAF